MEDKKKIFEKELLDYIKKAEIEYEKIEKEHDKIHMKMEMEKKNIESLRATLKIHQKSIGGTLQVKEARFNEVESVREACNIVLKEKGEMDRDKLIKELQDGGFDFKGKSPVRVVHIAMINNPYATITEDGTYKLITGQKKSLLSVPKAVKKFFKERRNEPASLKEIIKGLEEMEIETATKNLEGSIKNTLTRKKITEKLGDGRYKLK